VLPLPKTCASAYETPKDWKHELVGAPEN